MEKWDNCSIHSPKYNFSTNDHNPNLGVVANIYNISQNNMFPNFEHTFIIYKHPSKLTLEETIEKWDKCLIHSPKYNFSANDHNPDLGVVENIYNIAQQ